MEDYEKAIASCRQQLVGSCESYETIQTSLCSLIGSIRRFIDCNEDGKAVLALGQLEDGVVAAWETVHNEKEQQIALLDAVGSLPVSIASSKSLSGTPTSCCHRKTGLRKCRVPSAWRVAERAPPRPEPKSGGLILIPPSLVCYRPAYVSRLRPSPRSGARGCAAPRGAGSRRLASPRLDCGPTLRTPQEPAPCRATQDVLGHGRAPSARNTLDIVKFRSHEHRQSTVSSAASTPATRAAKSRQLQQAETQAWKSSLVGLRRQCRRQSKAHRP